MNKTLSTLFVLAAIPTAPITQGRTAGAGPSPALAAKDRTKKTVEESTPEGWVLVGDILYPEEVIETDAVYSTASWPLGIVPYVFDSNVSSSQRTKALAAMREWELVANVSFVPRDGESAWIHIQDSDENSAQVGFFSRQHVVNIDNWSEKFIIAHELAHVLGFFHEQSRPDRDLYVQINWENIDDGFDLNFQIQSSGVTEAGAYDFESIMHYDRCAFATCIVCPSSLFCGGEGGRTISTQPGFEAFDNVIGNRDYLSALDVAGMEAAYPLTAWAFVDPAYSGSDPEIGSLTYPHSDLDDAVDAVDASATIYLIGSSIPAGGLFTKPVTLEAYDGPVTLE